MSLPFGFSFLFLLIFVISVIYVITAVIVSRRPIISCKISALCITLQGIGFLFPILHKIVSDLSPNRY